MRLDPRHLSYLLAIHEKGSLSRAAESLGLSQPALSNSIAVLERRLGVRVLNRTGRGATVNDIGSILVRRSRELRSLLKGAEEEVHLRRKGQRGPLAIGAVPGLVEHLVPAALNVLRRDGAALSITVLEGLDGPLDESLLSGELDLVIGAVGRPVSPPDVVEELLLSDPFVLGVGRDSPLAGRRQVSLADARELPWVMPRPGGSAYAHVHATFLNAGIPWPQHCISTNSAVLTKRLISQSDAVGIINVLTLSGWDAPIMAIRIPEAGVGSVGVRRRQIGEPTPLAERFVQILREVSARLTTRSPFLSSLRRKRVIRR